MSDIPAFQHTMNPLLEVLRESAMPLPIEDIERLVAEKMALPPALMAIPHDAEKPDRSEVGYRIAWARTWLKKAGLVENPKRGRWTVTAKGRTAGRVDPSAVLAEVRAIYDEERAEAPQAEAASASSPEGDPPEAEADLEEEASTPRVGPVLASKIAALFEQLGGAGELPTREQVGAMLARFRERFGPQVLAGLDGAPLLERMHARAGGKDSLVHWLEFKEDEDFATSAFGSIAGGSALKFGLYQAAETGAWMAGSAQHQVRLEHDEAIARARQQRDQLVAAAKVLAAAGKPDAIDFERLHEQITAIAPDVADSAWGHKVLGLWFPEVIEPFHAATYQRHQLLRLLKLPLEGRYANAGYFVGIARQLGVTLLELGRVLARLNGSPYAVWRIGTKIDEFPEAWEAMRTGGFAAIGWDALGDLSDTEASKQGKEGIRSKLQTHYPNTASALSRSANQVYAFVRNAEERDLVVAMDGQRVLGVGRITGPYHFVGGNGGPHRRRVTWELLGEPWKLPETEGLLTTFVQLQKHALNIIEIEARLLGKGLAKPRVAAAPSVPPARSVVAMAGPATPAPVPEPPPPLTGVPGRIEAILARKRQVIVYGPPGTGKTHWASIAARELAARGWFGRAAGALSAEQTAELETERAIELVSFHPGYGYEDFLEGYRPAGGGAFELRDGVFKKLCVRAAADGKRPYFLVVDEINRGDVPRIFGELLTVIERDKRGRSITLPLSGEAFAVPDNVHLLGTMNTADRSIAVLDAALRRRFGFVELLPDATLFAGVKVDAIPLQAWLDALNDKVLEHAGRDARNLRVGHAYFLHAGAPVRERARFAEILRDDVIPLLEEVCYEDFDALERILGGAIVLRAKKRIASELFEPDRWDALQDAILQAFPGLSTTKAAAEADVVEQAQGEPDDDAEAEPASAGEAAAG